ncbi:hypothetical protein [Paracoccus aerodenitrificans]|uniref:hypothetical protein n=1 Tax=Paracoccus aerodenitrificans TaxID=3017781 RepID=UPI0022F0D6BC|nr:hypothetical protein [Paracoccus aerodenitrificans]WBU63581.1 hypothetical protein PAE61_14665 [Paracoccus aerodenitrificans]
MDNHPLVRLSQETTHTVTNPETGEQIGTTITPGDAEIWIEDLNSWGSALRWRSGRVSVNAPRDFDDENSFLRKLLRELATELGASIRGDEGENTSDEDHKASLTRRHRTLLIKKRAGHSILTEHHSYDHAIARSFVNSALNDYAGICILEGSRDER